MSEYLSVCPQCRKQILCDTAYLGRLVACPLCLRAIQMPNPPAPAGAAATAGARVRWPLSVVLGGAIFLVLSARAAIFLMQRTGATPATPPVSALAAVVTPQAATPPAARVSPAAAVPPATAPNLPVPAQAANSPVPRAIWSFEEQAGDLAMDGSGNGNNLKFVGYAGWTRLAKVGTGAANFSGSNYAEADQPVVDATQSFTVMAWVNLATLKDGQPCQTAVSIDGDETSAFFLQLNHLEGNVFAFNRPGTLVKSTFTPVANQWYHLAGVYDAGAGRIALYVNGALQGSAGYEDALAGPGKTAVGRALFNNVKTDFFHGSIDDVRLYDVALTAAQIQDVARR